MSKVVRILFQVFLILCLLELGLRAIMYQKTIKGPLAILESLQIIKKKIHTVRPTYLYKGFFLARPDSSEAVNKEIAHEVFESNRFQYYPWIDYRNIDYQGKYVSTKGLVRTSVPGEFINPLSPDTVIVYFLGGSTMYGEDVTDRETIPAAFVNLYRSRYPDGKSIKVENYGIRGFHSYSELMLLSHLIYSGRRPSILVVMDGLNDFIIPNAAKKRVPYYYYHLAATGKDDIDFAELYSVPDSTGRLFDPPGPGAATDSLRSCLLSQYLSNLKNMRDLAVANGIAPFFFIQPIAYYNYPNRKKDPVCDSSPNELIEKAYGILSKKADSIGNCTFLGNLLENRKGYPFIDKFHYSPAMSATIAGAILDVAGKKINGH